MNVTGIEHAVNQWIPLTISNSVRIQSGFNSEIRVRRMLLQICHGSSVYENSNRLFPYTVFLNVHQLLKPCYEIGIYCSSVNG